MGGGKGFKVVLSNPSAHWERGHTRVADPDLVGSGCFVDGRIRVRVFLEGWIWIQVNSTQIRHPPLIYPDNI